MSRDVLRVYFWIQYICTHAKGTFQDIWDVDTITLAIQLQYVMQYKQGAYSIYRHFAAAI